MLLGRRASDLGILQMARIVTENETVRAQCGQDCIQPREIGQCKKRYGELNHHSETPAAMWRASQRPAEFRGL